MLRTLKYLPPLALAVGLAAVPLATAGAADAPLPPGPSFTPPPAAAPAGIPGCYEVQSGLPTGFQLGFCLAPDHDGAYRLAGPGFVCERRLDWSDHGDNPVHIDLKQLEECGNAREILSDDLDCTVASPGLACVIDAERGIPPRQVFAARTS